MIPEALVAGSATFAGLALMVISAFMVGKIVAGGTYDRSTKLNETMAGTLERLTAALEKKNSIDERNVAVNETLIRDLRDLARRG